MNLKITFNELQREIGRHLGFNRVPSEWSADEAFDVADIIRRGESAFYWGNGDLEIPSHKWSFLCATEKIGLIAENANYDLPDDFIRLHSSFTFTSAERMALLASASAESIRNKRAVENLSGDPVYYAVRAKPQIENRYELLVYPTPDQAGVIEYTYEKSPMRLSEANPHHLGSAAHSQTLLMSCIMQADKSLNKEDVEANAQSKADFIECLRASISIDQQVYGQ